MAVPDMPHTAPAVVRDDPSWQRLNVAAFVVGAAVSETIGFPHQDADGATYLPLLTTGDDEENRAAVRAVPTEALDLVGLGVRAEHRHADAVLRGLLRHPGCFGCRGG